MARYGTKRPMLDTTSEATAVLLDKVSKAALIDLYLAALARVLGAADDPPSVAEVVADANPTLSVRGDKLLNG